MRVDLFSGGRRPLVMHLGLRFMKLYIGVYVGPPVAMSYRPDFFHRDFFRYISGAGGWDQGHVEMFSAFVSKLVACRF